MAWVVLAPVALWLAWCALLVLGVVLVPLVHRPTGNAYTNGLVIWVCPTLREKLTPRELAAILEHERGHRRHGHAWLNLARACVFLKMNRGLELRLEHQADDYAAARGYAVPLAGALRKLSPRTRDIGRGARLLDAHWALRRPASVSAASSE